MNELLPPNSTQHERHLSVALAGSVGIVVPIRELWSSVECPATLLPWLAWALSVDEWDTDWSEQQKRDTIAAAVKMQKIKGTIGAVRTALRALGIEVQVQEWFNQLPEAAPYTYRLYIDTAQQAAGKEALEKAISVSEANKNLRSHLAQIVVSTRSQSRPIIATAALIGASLTVTGFVPSTAVINETALVIG